MFHITKCKNRKTILCVHFWKKSFKLKKKVKWPHKLNSTVFDVPRNTLRISSPMRSLCTGITGVGWVARKSIPGVTDECDGWRGTTRGARGVTVRNRWLSNTRHTGVTAKIGTRNVYNQIRREITLNICFVHLLVNLDECWIWWFLS